MNNLSHLPQAVSEQNTCTFLNKGEEYEVSYKYKIDRFRSSRWCRKLEHKVLRSILEMSATPFSKPI